MNDYVTIEKSMEGWLKDGDKFTITGHKMGIPFKGGYTTVCKKGDETVFTARVVN